MVNDSEDFLANTNPRYRYQMLLSLFAIWKVTNKRFDSTLFSATSEATFRHDLADKNYFTQVLQKIEKGEAYEHVDNAMEVLPQVVAHEKEKGRVVGLKFGFYRRLTPPQIIEMSMANDYCNFMILIIESEERTRLNKTDRIELSDEQRMEIFGGSGLVNFVGRTSGDDFSNAYYRGLVNFIKPDVLFASSGWSQKTIDEYQLRADMVDARLQMLPMISDFSTTYMEKFIFD